MRRSTKPAAGPKPRGCLLELVALVVFVTLVVGAIFLTARNQRKDDEYGDLEVADASAFDGPGVVSGGGGGADARLGSGAAYFYSSVRNYGTHAVRATGVDTNEYVRDAQWAPFVPSADVFASPDRWRAFPATVPADGHIQIRISVGRPHSCADRPATPGSGLFYEGDYTLHWKTPRAAHELDGFAVDRRLQVC